MPAAPQPSPFSPNDTFGIGLYDSKTMLKSFPRNSRRRVLRVLGVFRPYFQLTPRAVDGRTNKCVLHEISPLVE